MASEAAILGVPAIYCGRDFPGYVRELEAADLLYNLPSADTKSTLALIDLALARPLADVHRSRDRYIETRPDWAHAVVDAIYRSIAKNVREL